MKNTFKFAGIFLTLLIVLAATALANPVLTNLPATRNVDEGQLLDFTVTSSPRNDSLTDPLHIKFCHKTSNSAECNLITNDGNGFGETNIGSTKANISRLTSTTARFKWMPGAAQSGTYTFSFGVGDTTSTDRDNLVVTVADTIKQLSVPASKLVGGESQVRSNPSHDDSDDEVVNKTETFTIKNNGQETINGISATLTLGSDASRATKGDAITLADLGISGSSSVTLDKTTLAPNENATATIIFQIPEKLSAVDNDGEETSWHVATLTYTGTASGNQIRESTNIRMQAENNLVIDDARVEFDDASDGIDDDDRVNNIRPGTDITLIFDIESKFKDDESVDIEDIELTINNDELDISEDVNPNDLSPDETDEVQVTFTIEKDASRGTETLEIILLGEDDHGAAHGEKWSVELEVERQTHEIHINEITLRPESVACQKDVELGVEVRNTGRSDEDEVFIRVKVEELGFDQMSREIDIDENDEYTSRFIIPIPEDTREGNYRVVVETFYDDDRRSQTETKVLKKTACKVSEPPVVTTKEEPVEKKPEPIVVVGQNTSPVPAANPPPAVTEPAAPAKEKTALTDLYENSTVFTVLMVLGFILVAGIGAAIAIKLLRK